jgi:hypothetical protein
MIVIILGPIIIFIAVDVVVNGRYRFLWLPFNPSGNTEELFERVEWMSSLLEFCEV